MKGVLSFQKVFQKLSFHVNNPIGEGIGNDSKPCLSLTKPEECGPENSRPSSSKENSYENRAESSTTNCGIGCEEQRSDCENYQTVDFLNSQKKCSRYLRMSPHDSNMYFASVSDEEQNLDCTHSFLKNSEGNSSGYISMSHENDDLSQNGDFENVDMLDKNSDRCLNISDDHDLRSSTSPLLSGYKNSEILLRPRTFSQSSSFSTIMFSQDSSASTCTTAITSPCDDASLIFPRD